MEITGKKLKSWQTEWRNSKILGFTSIIDGKGRAHRGIVQYLSDFAQTIEDVELCELYLFDLTNRVFELNNEWSLDRELGISGALGRKCGDAAIFYAGDQPIEIEFDGGTVLKKWHILRPGQLLLLDQYAIRNWQIRINNPVNAEGWIYIFREVPPISVELDEEK